MSLAVETPQETSLTPVEEPRLLFLYDGEFNIDNGVSNYIRTIGDYAMQQGCRVDYLVGKSAIDEPNVTSIAKTTPIHANGSCSIVPIYASGRHIKEVVERINPDTVHVQLPFIPFMSGKVIKSFKPETTIVGTFHTPITQGWLGAVNKINSRLTRSTMKRFDHFYSVSEVAQAAAKSIYGVDSEILPCPINLDHFRTDYQAASTDKTVITFLGRLVARKGASNFIESLDLLNPAIQDSLQIQIIGDGEDHQALERQVADSSLERSTTFFGKVDERRKFELLAGSDIVACTSNGGESFGIVLAEAMAARRPVVLASDNAGYSEVLRDASESLVTKDSEAMAQRLAILIADPDKRQTIFEAQQKVVQQFDITQTIGPKLMHAYGFASKETEL